MQPQRLKSHDFLTDGVFAQVLYLGLGEFNNITESLAGICNAWNIILDPVILPKICL